MNTAKEVSIEETVEVSNEATEEVLRLKTDYIKVEKLFINYNQVVKSINEW